MNIENNEIMHLFISNIKKKLYFVCNINAMYKHNHLRVYCINRYIMCIITIYCNNTYTSIYTCKRLCLYTV